MILVVGASGYLGGLLCKELAAAGRNVRAMVRPTSDTSYLKRLGVELVTADLNDPAGLPGALRGCTQVIFTASTAVPTRRGETVAADGQRAIAMIDAATAAKVEKFVYISAITPPGKLPALIRCKAEAEQHLRRSSLDYTILRCGAFMEVWLAMLGSAIPVVPVEPGLTHTLERPFAFGQKFYNRIRQDIDSKGVANVGGSGLGQNCYVATADVARIAAAALENPFCRRATLEVGNPPMTALAAVDLFSTVLGRPIRVNRTPLPLLRLIGTVVGLFNPAGSELIKASATIAELDATLDPTAFRQAFPDYRLQTPEEFLRERIGRMARASAS